MLEHRQQIGEIGCLYHSAFSITGDTSLLEHVTDSSAARYQVRLIERGFLTFTLFCSEPPEPPTSPGYWGRLRARFARDNATPERHAPLLVSIPGVTPGWLHQVAVLLPAHAGESLVCVSDSNFAHNNWMTWEEFLPSVYARAHRIEMLGPLDLDAYPAATHAPGGTP
ncbi:hypothetical protein [Deinococcus marmoris]|uniref:hypothetical protein n=1 Tax=Deinococcus marmoris TaxID=249408 RepID=UPI0004964B34|nr:hypothetical protein [Deinococcus marmoris]